MRTIKFRGKRINNKQWIYGYFFKTDVGCFVGEFNEEQQVIPESVGQFTGLLDKNGKEVYEKDIVQYSGINHIVDFYVHAFVFTDMTGIVKVYNLPSPNFIEIIGSTTDTPELLTVLK